MLNHYPQYCELRNCTSEATNWIECEVSEDKTFYLCQEHAETLGGEDGVYAELDPLNNTIKFIEIAVYSCSEQCEVCND